MIYDYPQYYEVAFSFRDIPREAAFMKTCIDRHSEIPVKRVFEIACGLAPHAGEFAGHGYRYLGLDNNRHMLDFAADKWRSLEPHPEFVEADMTSFKLPAKVDFAYVMLGSLYVNTETEMVSHFDAMAEALRPGGLYFLDWCIQFEDPLKYADNNAVSFMKDDIKVESKFDIRLVDPGRQIYEEVWTMDVNDHGSCRRLQMVERNRAVYPQEFLAFISSRSDYEFVGWWRDWDLARPITDGSENSRPVALLRRV